MFKTGKEKVCDLSVVVPVFNEKENLSLLILKLLPVLNKLKLVYEVIFVDDGSKDGSSELLDQLAAGNRRVKVVHFGKNCGQTGAMMAGFDFAKGEVIVPMDADLQNDPTDVPRLLTKINEGFDVVSGWRRKRHDSWRRVMPSRLANWLISKISGVPLHDYGCSLKAYRRNRMEGVRLYGEMHRFIPIYAHMQGARVTEIEVKHHSRKYGKSKYGINRTLKVLLDLVVIKFLAQYSQKPIYVFGGYGLLSILLSIVCFVLTIYFKYWGGKSFVETPLPLLVVMFFLMGFQSILIGLIAEMLVRTYYETQKKSPYLVRGLVNFE